MREEGSGALGIATCVDLPDRADLAGVRDGWTMAAIAGSSGWGVRIEHPARNHGFTVAPDNSVRESKPLA